MERMPLIGIGTADVRISEMNSILSSAVSSRVFLFDCAKVYGNEESVGRTLKELIQNDSRLDRTKFFIISKLWNDDHNNVEKACRDSLKRLDLEYIDLYLIHWPTPWKKGTVYCPNDSATLEETWKEMEKLVHLGLAKRIGLSNFDETNTRKILSACVIPPYANELEIHPLLSQRQLVEFNERNNIKVIAYSPLGQYDSIKDIETLNILAHKKNKTIPQVVLRWHYQRNISSIPRSKHPSRISSNASILDFELTSGEMEEIYSINQNKRLCRDWFGVFDSTPDFPYRYPIRSIVSWFFRIVFLLVPNKIDIMGNPFTK